MPAAIASAAMSSARSRLRTTRCFRDAEQGASVNPQLPITTVVTPCQHEHVPSGSQKTCASMWVWPSMNPGATTRPSASMTSRARSRILPVDDPTVPDGDVGAVARQAGAIDQGAVLDDEIVGHRPFLPRSLSYFRRPARGIIRAGKEDRHMMRSEERRVGKEC